MKFSLDFKTIVIILLGLILLYWIACNPRARGKVSREAYTAVKDSLEWAIQYAKEVTIIADSLERKNSETDSMAAQVAEENRLLTAELKIQDQQLGQMTTKILKAAKEKDTGTLVNECPELAIAVNNYRNEAKNFLRQKLIQDSLHKVQQAQSGILIAYYKSAFDSVMNVIDFAATELPKLKPKRFQMFIGIKGSYTPETGAVVGPQFPLLINGTTLLTPSMEIGRTTLYSIGVAKLLTFKRN